MWYLTCVFTVCQFPFWGFPDENGLTLAMLNKLRCHTQFWFSANQITWSNLLIQIHIVNDKQGRSRSVGFFRSQLIWIYTVCKERVYPGSSGLELKITVDRTYLVYGLVSDTASSIWTALYGDSGSSSLSSASWISTSLAKASSRACGEKRLN